MLWRLGSLRPYLFAGLRRTASRRLGPSAGVFGHHRGIQFRAQMDAVYGHARHLVGQIGCADRQGGEVDRYRMPRAAGLFLGRAIGVALRTVGALPALCDGLLRADRQAPGQLCGQGGQHYRHFGSRFISVAHRAPPFTSGRSPPAPPWLGRRSVAVYRSARRSSPCPASGLSRRSGSCCGRPGWCTYRR
jgi:hypothetical protein